MKCNVLLLAVGLLASVFSIHAMEETALFKAARTDDVALASQALIGKGQADLDAYNDREQTPLLVALWNGAYKVAEFLIKHGADINKVNHRGQTPLLAVLWNEYYDAAKFLIKHGADVNRQEAFGRLKLFPLLVVVMRPSSPSGIEVLQLLLNRPEINVNQADTKNGTALMHAVGRMNVEAVKLLLDHHADVNLRLLNGETALTMAENKAKKTKPGTRLHEIMNEIVKLLKIAAAQSAEKE